MVEFKVVHRQMAGFSNGRTGIGLESPPLKEFPTRWWISKLLPSGFSRISTVFSFPRSEALCPVKNSKVKNAKSRAWIYLTMAVVVGLERSARKWRTILWNLLKNRDVASIGDILAIASLRSARLDYPLLNAYHNLPNDLDCWIWNKVYRW